MTVRQFLSALNSNMIICTILDKNDNVIVENSNENETNLVSTDEMGTEIIVID